jgi:hypothetical protein
MWDEKWKIGGDGASSVWPDRGGNNKETLPMEQDYSYCAAEPERFEVFSQKNIIKK